MELKKRDYASKSFFFFFLDRSQNPNLNPSPLRIREREAEWLGLPGPEKFCGLEVKPISGQHFMPITCVFLRPYCRINGILKVLKFSELTINVFILSQSKKKEIFHLPKESRCNHLITPSTCMVFVFVFCVLFLKCSTGHPSSLFLKKIKQASHFIQKRNKEGPKTWNKRQYQTKLQSSLDDLSLDFGSQFAIKSSVLFSDIEKELEGYTRYKYLVCLYAPGNVQYKAFKFSQYFFI